MRKDTTNPRAHASANPLFTGLSNSQLLHDAERIRFKLMGLYHADVGEEWTSNGMLETDYVHHIAFIRKGFAQVIHEGNALDLAPGFAYWFPGNTPVERRCPNQMELYYFKFQCEWFEGVDLLLDWPHRHPFCLGPWDVPALTEEWGTGSLLSFSFALRLQGQLRIWLAQHFQGLEAFIASHHVAYARFGDILRMLDEKWNAALKVSDLARADRTSVNTFSRAFTRSLGISPKAYLNRKVNQVALRLLLDTNLPIKAIAEKLQFADEFYFNRFFTKLNGIPPSTYRKRKMSIVKIQ